MSGNRLGITIWHRPTHSITIFDIGLDLRWLSVRWMQDCNLCVFLLFLHKPPSPLAIHGVFSIAQKFVYIRCQSPENIFNGDTFVICISRKSSDPWCSCRLVAHGSPTYPFKWNWNRIQSAPCISTCPSDTTWQSTWYSEYCTLANPWKNSKHAGVKLDSLHCVATTPLAVWPDWWKGVQMVRPSSASRPSPAGLRYICKTKSSVLNKLYILNACMIYFSTTVNISIHVCTTPVSAILYISVISASDKWQFYSASGNASSVLESKKENMLIHERIWKQDISPIVNEDLKVFIGHRKTYILYMYT